MSGPSTVDLLAVLDMAACRERDAGMPDGVQLAARDVATKLIETLETCEFWFAKHSPTAPLINGCHAEHPMLTMIRATLART